MTIMKRFLPLLCLTLLLVIAGCTGGPFGGPSKQDQPMHLVLNNSANVTQTYEVAVVEAGTNVKFHFNDSKTVNSTIIQGVGTASSGEYYYYTGVKFPNSTTFHKRYTLQPGETKRKTIKEFKTNSAIVVILWQDNKSGSWASGYCHGGEMTGFKATGHWARWGRLSAGIGCDNSWF